MTHPLYGGGDHLGIAKNWSDFVVATFPWSGLRADDSGVHDASC